MIEKLDWEDLGISSNGMVHIDNTTRENLDIHFQTWCGQYDSENIYPLIEVNRHYNLKLCKKCSNIYYKKYKEPFFRHIAVLKLKDKLFI